MPSTKKPTQNEADLKSAIVKYLKSVGVLAWRNPVSLYGRSGRPDIEGVLPGGRALFIEAKRPGKYTRAIDGLTDVQIAWIDQLVETGARVLVVDSLDAVKVLDDKFH